MGRPVSFERSTTVSEVDGRFTFAASIERSDSAATVVAPLWQNADAIFFFFFFLFGQNIEQA